jgi:hypothetical protein
MSHDLRNGILIGVAGAIAGAVATGLTVQTLDRRLSTANVELVQLALAPDETYYSAIEEWPGGYPRTADSQGWVPGLRWNTAAWILDDVATHLVRGEAARIPAFLDSVRRTVSSDEYAAEQVAVAEELAAELAENPEATVQSALRRLSPVLDATFHNGGSEAAILHEVEVEVLRIVLDQGDTGSMPLGDIVPVLQRIVIHMPEPTAEVSEEYDFTEPVRLLRPLRRIVNVEPVSVAADGSARIRLEFRYHPDAPSGVWGMRLRFGFHNSADVRTEEFLVRFGQ